MVSVISEVSDRKSIALNTRAPRLKNHGDDDPEPYIPVTIQDAGFRVLELFQFKAL